MASEERQQRIYPVDAGVWRACAGSFIHLPSVNSRVLYFPQGHAEQASFPMSLPPEVAATAVSCLLTDVSFFADPDTEEVFVKYNLEPLKTDMQGFANDVDVHVGCNVERNENDGYFSYNKVLTTSDANNGGGFSVNRFCAETIFPGLNFKDDPPLQYLDITDVHGNLWKFRHIYRGTPRRHLLTSGWSKFVNHKKLITGDTVVFVRNIQTRKMFIGVRRTFCGTPDWDDIRAQEGEEGQGPQCGGFSRAKRGRVQPRAVMEAAERALTGFPFEAVYYPRAGMAEFVVAANKAVCGIRWNPGDRVKIPLEFDEVSRYSWFVGSVVSVNPGWRMLQVKWDDDYNGLQNMNRVNPWQVELVKSASPVAKCNYVQEFGLHVGTRGGLVHSVGFHSMMDPLHPSHCCNSFLRGIQGTRQMLNSVSNFTNLPEGITNPGYHGDDVNNSSQRSPSAYSGSVITFGAAATEQQSCELNRAISFRLFGKTIDVALANGIDMNCTKFDDDITTEEIRLSLVG